MKKTFLFLLAMVPMSLVAQDGHKLNFTIKELKDTTIYLGYYFGESTFLKDTARSDRAGRFIFSGANRLDRGIYFLVLGKAKLFEPGFLVGDDQTFAMEMSTADYVRTMKVTGDEDNRLFFENMVFNAERHQEAEPHIKILKDSTLREEQKKDAREAYLVIDKQVRKRQDEIIAMSPKTLTAKLLKVNRGVEMPDPPRKANGSIDSAAQFRYYRKHFFDNFDLSDDGMMRLPTPMYQNKVNEYLDKLYIQTPDSVMVGIENLASLAKPNKETYKYMVWTCIFKYQKPTIMGLDEVFVRVYDKYIVSGEMDYWITAALRKSVRDHAEKLRLSLVGKKGADLVMQDKAFQRKSLYEIKKKYSVLYFFDPDCGHCKEETPKLVNFYNRQKEKFNLEVFAISLDTSMQKMRDYIRDMKMTWITVNGPRSYAGSYATSYYAETTPMLYILDEKKKIIAKGLAVDRVEEFLVNYERFEQRKAASKAKGS